MKTVSSKETTCIMFWNQSITNELRKSVRFMVFQWQRFKDIITFIFLPWLFIIVSSYICALFLDANSITGLFIKKELFSVITSSFSAVLGFKLTAYAIMLAIPSELIREFQKTQAYQRLNNLFFVGVLIDLSIVVLSSLGILLETPVLVYSVVFLCTLSILILTFLLWCISQLIIIASNH